MLNRWKRPRYSDRVKELIADQFAEGASVAQLVAAGNLSTSFVRRHLVRADKVEKYPVVKVVEVEQQIKTADREMLLSLETNQFRVCVFGSGAGQ